MRPQFDLQKYLGIDTIKDDTAILNDGTMVAVLRINPSSDSRKAEAHFRLWLESIDYPVQVTARTVNADIVQQCEILMSSLENHLKQLPNSKQKLKRCRQLQQWLMKKAENSLQRLFFIAIPYTPYYSNRTQQAVRTNYFHSLDILKHRAEQAVKTLSPGGFEVRRMDSSEIRNLYLSYFTLSIYRKRHVTMDELSALFELEAG